MDAPSIECTRISADEDFSLLVRGRRFSAADLAQIRHVIEHNGGWTRAELSRHVCKVLGWYQANGRLKARACRDALLRFQRLGLIRLPPPTYRWRPTGKGVPLTARTDPGSPIDLPAGALGRLHLDIVTGPVPKKAGLESLWNEYIERYHYLGYKIVVGPQLKYFVRFGRGVVGCMAFGGAAWKLRGRDEWIGWSAEQRQANLHLVINNVRFLIFPWIRSRNLASRILSLAARRVPEDWMRYYGYRPVLMETFVDLSRYRGTCYKAANWVFVGLTAGRGKFSTTHRSNRPRKGVFIYPLCRKAQRFLCGDREGSAPSSAGGAP